MQSCHNSPKSGGPEGGVLFARPNDIEAGPLQLSFQTLVCGELIPAFLLRSTSVRLTICIDAFSRSPELTLTRPIYSDMFDEVRSTLIPAAMCWYLAVLPPGRLHLFTLVVTVTAQLSFD